TAIIETVRSTVDQLNGLTDEVIVRSLVAWTQLFGLVSFELYGHLLGVVDDLDAFFNSSVRQMGLFVGLLENDAP
ncbi:MAG: TetR-like C-terminal domain-containing protein, partial [Acidimicrobiales bacterium]